MSAIPVARPLGEPIPLKDHLAIVEALAAHHKIEKGKLGMQVAVYRLALEQAGIEPPDDAGADFLQMWKDASAVISTASEFVHHLGTSREMLDERWSEASGSRDTWSRPFGTHWRDFQVVE